MASSYANVAILGLFGGAAIGGTMLTIAGSALEEDELPILGPLITLAFCLSALSNCIKIFTTSQTSYFEKIFTILSVIFHLLAITSELFKEERLSLVAKGVAAASTGAWNARQIANRFLTPSNINQLAELEYVTTHSPGRASTLV